MPSRISSRVFVGRRLELARVVAALESRSPVPSAFVVAGEAGVGKSRFAVEIGDMARDRGARVLTGGCIDLSGQSLPFASIIEAFRSLTSGPSLPRLDDLLGPFDATIGSPLPELLAGAMHRGVADGPDALMQGRLFELILGVVARLAEATPVVFVVEDLHWADRSTLDLLAFLIRNLRHEPIVVLMTYRSDQVDRRHRLLPFLAELERSGRAERIHLGRFDRSEMTEQLAGILGGPPIAGLVERIRSRSEGNAFFTEELLAATATDGPLPETLRDVLFARTSSLTDAAQKLLQVASVAGGPVDAQLLQLVMDADDMFLPALRETLDAHILVRPHSTDGESIAFRHALLREAVYEDLLSSERTRLHAAFAQALTSASDARTAGVRFAQLAYHWEASGDLERALPAAVRAGMAAAEGYAFPEANAQYERALELWDRLPDAATRAGLDRVELLERAAATAAAAAIPTSVSRITEAIALIDPSADPTRGGLLHERLGRYRWINGDGSGSLAAHREAVRLVPSDPPSAARARVAAGLGQILMILGNFENSIVLCKEAVAAAQAVGSREVECHALNTLGIDTAYLGDVDGGLQMLEHSLGIASEIGLTDDVARAYVNMADVLGVSARFSDAVVIGFRCDEYAIAHGLGSFYGIAGLCEAAGALYRSGRWDDANAALVRVQQREARGVSEIDLHLRLAAIEVGRGRHDDAHRRLGLVRRLSEHAIDLQYLVPLTEVAAELAVWEGRPGDAGGVIADGLARVIPSQGANISRFGPLYALAVRAAADSASLARMRGSQESVEEARSNGVLHLGSVHRVSEEINRRWPAFALLGEAYRSLCDAEFARLEARVDADRWATTVAAWDALKMPYRKAYASWRYAEALLASKAPREGARTTLREAHDIAVSIGAEPLRLAIEASASMGRVDLGDGPGASEAPFDLTSRERQVLALVASGLTNRQIGERLFITEKTASVHVSNILGKLGVTSRTQAGAVAHRLGLIDPG